MSTAAEVMTTDVVSVGAETPVREIAQLLLAKRISAVPVVDPEGRLLGIISEGDLIGHASVLGERRRSWWLNLFSDDDATAREYIKAHGRSARDVMTANVVSVDENAPLASIAEAMHRHRVKRVPVVRDGSVVGIVSRSDLLRSLVVAVPRDRGGLDDHAIRGQLIAELDGQPWAHLIDVQVEDGVVHLHGTFKSEEERHALRVAAENVPGVIRVEDHLSLWTSSPIRLSGQG